MSPAQLTEYYPWGYAMKKRILTPEEVGALLDWNPSSGARTRDLPPVGPKRSPATKKAGLSAGSVPPEERLYRDVLDVLGEAMIITDPRGRILFGNALSCTLLGKSLASIRKKPFDRSVLLVDAHGNHLVPGPVVEALNEKEKIPFPPGTGLSLSHGEILSVTGSATPILSGTGEIEGVAVTFHRTALRAGLPDPFPSAPRRRAR